MRRSVALIILYVCIFPLYSQNFTRPGDWKKFRKEVFVTMGTANFLGDLGGRSKIGTDYSPVDLNFQETRTSFGLAYRYKILRWLNIASKFNYLIVRGNDALTAEPFRHNRNLNFKSNIFELSGRIEIGWQSQKTGNRYGIKRTLNRRMKSNNQCIFLFAGIGGFYYNPKGYGPSGYVSLKPLHTEGQGLAGGPKQYTNYSVCIPLGIYYKATFQKVWTVGIEFAWRKTFTDYIDDVSSRYYDNASISAAYGPLAAQMADPSLGVIQGATLPDGSGVAAQRGDIQKDSYVTLELTVGYIFKQKRKRARLRSKF
ncbi:MAG: hypothetical protein H0W61_01070 [Bacteroidetes bacterium]|nr:hypothetical protein [Bacteroidota bacterium]